MPVLPLWFRICSRVRGVTMPAGFIGVAAGVLGAPDPVGLVGFVLIVAGLVLAFLPLAPEIRPRAVSAPVAGRWSALNSPASKVPSHGVHSNGQTYAIDLVYEPAGDGRPRFGEGPAFRPPEDFPAFGEEVFAPAEGRVVAVRDGARDHQSRSTWAAYAFMIAEGFVRELAGPRYLLGNYVVIELGEETYAAYAHLQRGSLVVRPGQDVRAGDVIGRCGNSGNSSEPHVHFQLMDRRRPFVAAGLPFVFADVSIEGRPVRSGVPANEETMVAERSVRAVA